jgi:hypothetical protein
VASELLSGVRNGILHVSQGRDQQVREKTERWMQLAALAATEQDPQKLSELIREIDRLLQEKQDRLNAKQIHPKPSE